MSSQVRFAVAACVAVALASSGRAYAFSTQGHHWANQAGEPVLYMLQPDGSDDVADGSDLDAIRHAFATWQSVSCSYLEFRETPWVDPAGSPVANDGGNRIQWLETDGQWPSTPATLALTYTFYRLDDGIITDADIIVNGVNWSFTTVDADIGTGTPAKVDLETVLFHETGHFFGLDHSMDESAAMYPSNNKRMQRTPALDDVQGMCSLYSNGSEIPQEPNTPPQTGTGGQVGEPCQAAQDCASSLCVQDDSVNRTYCTAQCNPVLANACPSGYQCFATAQGDYCLAPATVDDLCDVCDRAGQCANGLCTTVAGYNNNRPFCTQPCDPTPGQPTQCPTGYQCEAVLGAAGGACSPSAGVCEPAGKGGQNEVCFANGTCKAGFTCVEYYPGSGLNFCYFSCSIQFVGASCSEGGGTMCAAVANQMNTAVCFSVATVGEPCIPEICDSTSFCAYDEGQGVDSALCYQTCDNGQCGPQSQCMNFGLDHPLCVPLEGYKYEGEACTGDNECRSRTCRTYRTKRLCTATCSTTDPASCGRGLQCVPESSSTQGLCWPESFTDGSAQDQTRNVTQRPPPPGFCSCDFSNACDPNCECDPECGGGGCGCTTAGGESSSALALGLLGLMLALARVRRRA